MVIENIVNKLISVEGADESSYARPLIFILEKIILHRLRYLEVSIFLRVLLNVINRRMDHFDNVFPYYLWSN